MPLARLPALLFVGVLLAIVAALPAQARPATQAQVDHGRYLAQVAGCITCHTPFQAKYADPSQLSVDDLRTLSFAEHDALDMDRLLSGGRPFDLGPAGVIQSRNLTPDPDTGLGKWTDTEIKNAIRTGAARGRQLHPIMPYMIYAGMAESDLDALVAYLRSLSPVANAIPEGQDFPLPPAPAVAGVAAPDPADSAARGKYLLSSVLPCAHCHTSVDNVTGQPDPARYLAGGQPYEGPWGIVYAANLTPDPQTGIGGWSDEAIVNVLKGGIHKDGRRLALMPWQDYTRLTEQDVAAVLHALRNDVPTVANPVPAAALKPEFVVRRAAPAPAATSGWPVGLIVAIAAVAVALAGVALVLVRRRAVA
jgi:mono/diheme cytochrome c family protein